MSKNRGKSKLSKTVLFNANKHVFHCEKSLGTLFYGHHPLVREGASHQETRNRQTENKNLVMGYRWWPDTKTD
jgi:hypothetical protein